MCLRQQMERCHQQSRSIISRRPHGNLPKFTLNYFGGVAFSYSGYGSLGIVWSLIEDINTVLSNVEFKSQ